MMNNKLQFKALTKNVSHYQQKLLHHLIQFNTEQTRIDSKRKPLFLGYFDSKNKLIAGLYGYLRWKIFCIDFLWVNKKYRQQKLGSQLLLQAEKYARKKKAEYIRLSTASFQAPNFYLKHGYKIFAKLPLPITNKHKEYDYHLIKFLRKNREGLSHLS
jgi:ribosomal protein S18 acetylase RimI-like enzyme